MAVFLGAGRAGAELVLGLYGLLVSLLSSKAARVRSQGARATIQNQVSWGERALGVSFVFLNSLSS